MSFSVMVQGLLVGACVLFAGIYTLARYTPGLLTPPRRWLAGGLLRAGYPRLADLLTPPATSGGGCHSGGGDAGGTCSSCGSCGTAEKAVPTSSGASEHPLLFHRQP